MLSFSTFHVLFLELVDHGYLSDSCRRIVSEWNRNFYSIRVVNVITLIMMVSKSMLINKAIVDFTFLRVYQLYGLVP